MGVNFVPVILLTTADGVEVVYDSWCGEYNDVLG